MNSTVKTDEHLKYSWLRQGQRVLNLNIRHHLVIAALLRLILVAYGQLHDAKSPVPYTDIDYKVVTDGARLVLAGDTPFARHTYRYSPIMAYMQILNIILHPAMGKVIYAEFDILIGVLIYALVRIQLKFQYQDTAQYLLTKCRMQALPSSDSQEHVARTAACFWLYNPLTAVISTRGSGDCFAGFFVLLTIYLIIRSEHQISKCWTIFFAGLAHGFVIHLRLYPIFFSLAYYLCLSTDLARKPRDLLRQIFFPNKQQLCLVIGTLLGLVSFTWTFYSLYGWQYMHEAYFYHFVRKDVRHNFSFQFLLQYLGNADEIMESTAVAKLLVLAPQLLLILYLTLSFGRFRQTLPFCIFSLAFVAVTYNSVVTSQYFIWYLAVFPLCFSNFHRMELSRCLLLVVLWICGQGLWLLPAYLLEFKTWNTFYWIGLQGAIFFIINNYILAQLINNYGFRSFKVKLRKCL